MLKYCCRRFFSPGTDICSSAHIAVQAQQMWGRKAKSTCQGPSQPKGHCRSETPNAIAAVEPGRKSGTCARMKTISNNASVGLDPMQAGQDVSVWFTL